MTAARHLLFLLFAGFFLLLLPATPHAAAESSTARLTGTVTWVHDADTLDIEPYGKVRLIGIDAPEKHASSRDDKFVALGASRLQLRTLHAEGRAWCIRTVKGQKVTLRFDQTHRDRYGRLLAYVYLADGRLLNRLLLEEGLVIVYRRFPFQRKNEFLAAEAGARQRRVGLWQKPTAARLPGKKVSNSLGNLTTPLLREQLLPTPA